MFESQRNFFDKKLDQNFYKLLGALILDSKFKKKIYSSFCTLLPYIFIKDEQNNRDLRIKCSKIFVKDCLKIIKDKNLREKIIPFTQNIFKLSMDAFDAKTHSINEQQI